VKLYKVVPIVGHFAHEINASLARLEHEHDEIHCVPPYSAFVPAPEAERAVRAWKRLEAACAPWPPERIAVWIRDIADQLSSEWISTGGLPTQLRKLADALAEAEGGEGDDD